MSARCYWNHGWDGWLGNSRAIDPPQKQIVLSDWGRSCAGNSHLGRVTGLKRLFIESYKSPNKSTLTQRNTTDWWVAIKRRGKSGGTSWRRWVKPKNWRKFETWLFDRNHLELFGFRILWEGLKDAMHCPIVQVNQHEFITLRIHTFLFEPCPKHKRKSYEKNGSVNTSTNWLIDVCQDLLSVFPVGTLMGPNRCPGVNPGIQHGVTCGICVTVSTASFLSGFRPCSIRTNQDPGGGRRRGQRCWGGCGCLVLIRSDEATVANGI